MKRQLLLTFAVVCLVNGHFSSLSSAQNQSDQRPYREVAVTFDDLPGVSMLQNPRCTAKLYFELNRKLVRSITNHRIPALGLVVESRICENQRNALADLLRIWLDAGLELGNHSYSHFDLNTTPLELYQADVIRGEATTNRLLKERGKQLKYFRHPFLHAGKDLATKSAFEEFLSERNYTIAPVTIDNQEWVFAAVYSKALDRREHATARRIAAAYLTYMDEIFDFFEKLSVAVMGYEIKQVLLLHANPLNADYFDEIVAMMKRRSYRFISLTQALEDPAYRSPDRYAGPRGLSWLHRWALTKGMTIREEPREPEFIARLYREYHLRGGTR